MCEPRYVYPVERSLSFPLHDSVMGGQLRLGRSEWPLYDEKCDLRRIQGVSLPGCDLHQWFG